jgi:hypothetical protein
MKKQLITLGALVGGFVIGASALVAVAGTSTWSAPHQTPSSCDPALDSGCNAPVNVGSADQAKVGGLNIGTASINTNTKLDVENGTIKAGGGLIIETRASNPTSPETGRMWLITP